MRTINLRLAAAAALVVSGAALPATQAAVPGPSPCGPVTTSGVSVAPWSEDLGTGEDYGVPHAYTTVDPDWTIHPGNGPTYSIAPVSSWVTVPNANWINSRPTSASSGGGVVIGGEVDARRVTEPLDRVVDTSPVDRALGGTEPIGVSVALPTSTTFRTSFTLPNLSYARSLTLKYAADNGVSFYLNGVPIGGFNPPATSSNAQLAVAFNQLHTLVWTGGGFVNGVNHLDAVVSDYGVATGLLVTGSADACVVRSEPGTCVRIRKDGLGYYAYSPRPYDLGTGESGHVPFAPGTIDDDWTTVAPVSGPAYAISAYPGWQATSATSSWINSQPAATGGLYGTRTYQVTFPLYAGASQQLLSLRFAVDNGVLFYLNGSPTPIGGFNPPATATNQQLAQAFRNWHTLTYSGPGFVTGQNVLTAVVSDYGVASGLIVEGGVAACYEQIAT